MIMGAAECVHEFYSKHHVEDADSDQDAAAAAGSDGGDQGAALLQQTCRADEAAGASIEAEAAVAPKSSAQLFFSSYPQRGVKEG